VGWKRVGTLWKGGSGKTAFREGKRRVHMAETDRRDRKGGAEGAETEKISAPHLMKKERQRQVKRVVNGGRKGNAGNIGELIHVRHARMTAVEGGKKTKIRERKKGEKSRENHQGGATDRGFTQRAGISMVSKVLGSQLGKKRTPGDAQDCGSIRECPSERLLKRNHDLAITSKKSERALLRGFARIYDWKGVEDSPVNEISKGTSPGDS